jgi:putative CocE/NonD family hydrolase
MVDRSSTLQTLIKYGYVIVVVDARGSGASFGTDSSPHSQQEVQHIYEITEWLADQSWCNGNVGMFGLSYSGHMQFLAASKASPHLKAIFPSMAAFDIYNIIYPGGVFIRPCLPDVDKNQIKVENPSPPVDEDPNGEMRAAALLEHKNNYSHLQFLSKFPYRNSTINNFTFWIENTPATYLQDINNSGVAIYQWVGWFDMFIRDAFLWHANLKTPYKLAIGPWSHFTPDSAESARRQTLIATEQLRWFDYWLKGIDNGIMDEPAINYVKMRGEDEYTWNKSETWPLPNVKNVSYYFSAGPSGSIQSINDGFLKIDSPTRNAGNDNYIVDYTTTAGKENRWPPKANANYMDLAPNDKKGLTYTSMPLEDDVTVIGHPVIKFYFSSNVQNIDFYLYLEEVGKNGYSNYITEGNLRASLRAVFKPAFNNLDMPYHRIFEQDVTPLPVDETVEITFDLLPVSWIFKKGNRIRVTITCADIDHTESIILNPAPTVTLYRNNKYASNIVLPVIQKGK